MLPPQVVKSNCNQIRSENIQNANIAFYTTKWVGNCDNLKFDSIDFGLGIKVPRVKISSSYHISSDLLSNNELLIFMKYVLLTSLTFFLK